MKIIVAVIVYDRFKNIEEWIRCWKLCNTENSELIIIHNFKNETETEKYEELCKNSTIRYVSRRNIGMDIGALQDVCRGRLEGFPNEWDYLLWCTDDVIPMSKDFISPYIQEIQKPDVGAVCLEISREIKLHIRTTGFMVSQLTASKITFPADIVENKNHCYEFEHRSHNAFYEQIRQMGKHAVQITPKIKTSYLWDTHVRAHLDRWEEHYKEFPCQK